MRLRHLPVTDTPDTVLVVDFGAQYAQLIARRVREARVYSEIVRYDTPGGRAARAPARGASSSRAARSRSTTTGPRRSTRRIYDAGVPILGICYGAQLLTRQLGGTVARTGRGEYGRTPLTRTRLLAAVRRLAPRALSDVWMSHADAITEVPAGFVATASTPDAPVAALDDPERRIYGVQFHPEVVHTERGQELLERFLFDVCGARPCWTHTSIIESPVEAVRAQVGGARVLCALSGGVDSAVAAALVHRAVGDQLTCVFVDTGLMRAGESEQVEETFRRQFHVDLVHVKAADRFFGVLAGRDRSRGEAQDHRRDVHPDLRGGGARRRGRRASSCRGPSTPTSSSRARATPPPSSRTTTWAGCPRTWPSTSSSPCACCSRTRCARSARSSASPRRSSGASPSPGPGLAVRIVGEVTPERAEILRAADAIVRRGDPPGGPLPRAVAELRRAARRPHRGGHGRRPHLRLPDRDPGGHQRRRHDRRLGAAALRPARAALLAASSTRWTASTGWRSTSRRSRPAPSSGSDRGRDPAAPLRRSGHVRRPRGRARRRRTGRAVHAAARRSGAGSPAPAATPARAARRPGAGRAGRDSMPPPDALLEGLNDPQRRAVVHRGGPLLVVAGRRLGQDPGAHPSHRPPDRHRATRSPWEILAITFTNKAADEMRERVVELVGPGGRADVGVDLPLGLRAHPARPRRPARLQALVHHLRRHRLAPAGRARRCADLDIDTKKLPPARCRPRSRRQGRARRRRAVHGRAARSVFDRRIADVYDEYQQRLLAANAMDFDDLLLLHGEALPQLPDVLEHYQQRFTHVLVDEYQDTNRAQNEIVLLLGAGHHNIASSATATSRSTGSAARTSATSSSSRRPSPTPRSSPSTRTSARPRPSSTPPTR